MSADRARGPLRAATAAGRALWQRWTRVARRIGDVQARILLTTFYFLVLGPFALVLRRGDPLALRPAPTPAWRPRGGARPAPEQARTQF